jgi:hypothetical protein
MTQGNLNPKIASSHAYLQSHAVLFQFCDVAEVVIICPWKS